jgi:hypothetical protein
MPVFIAVPSNEVVHANATLIALRLIGIAQSASTVQLNFKNAAKRLVRHCINISIAPYLRQ